MERGRLSDAQDVASRWAKSAHSGERRTDRWRSPELHRLSLILLLAAAACAHSPPADHSAISVTGPTVVGFFPPLSQSDFDDPATGASEGLAHVQFALSDTAKCLESISPVVHLELTRTLRLDVGGLPLEIELPRDPGRSFGAFLFDPPREPRAVFATVGPSSLQYFLPNAAADYFDVPACRVDF